MTNAHVPTLGAGNKLFAKHMPDYLQLAALQEMARDAVAAMLVSGANITITNNDAGDMVTVTATGADAELVRDTIGAAIAGVGGVVVTVNDAADTIVLSLANVPISAVTALQTTLDAKLPKTTGGYVPVANLAPGDTLTVRKDPTTGFWPASYDTNGSAVYTGGSASAGVRPTARSDIFIHWKGWQPFPPTVTTGSGGVRDNLDMKIEIPAP